MTISEMIAEYRGRVEKKNGGKACACCGKVLQETVTGNRITDKGSSCSDCYYQAMGTAVEEHPITTARAFRG